MTPRRNHLIHQQFSHPPDVISQRRCHSRCCGAAKVRFFAQLVMGETEVVGKQGNHQGYPLFFCTEPFKEGAFPCAKGLVTAMALVTWSFATMDTDIARPYFASCGTRLVGAKLL